MPVKANAMQSDSELCQAAGIDSYHAKHIVIDKFRTELGRFNSRRSHDGTLTTIRKRTAWKRKYKISQKSDNLSPTLAQVIITEVNSTGLIRIFDYTQQRNSEMTIANYPSRFNIPLICTSR